MVADGFVFGKSEPRKRIDEIMKGLERLGNSRCCSFEGECKYRNVKVVGVVPNLGTLNAGEFYGFLFSPELECTKEGTTPQTCEKNINYLRGLIEALHSEGVSIMDDEYAKCLKHPFLAEL